MKTALLYPFELFVFWYHDVCLGVIDYFTRANSYLVHAFSISLLLKTFFKPLKNEYRKGLVLFSIVFGIFVKSFLVAISFCLIGVVIAIELIIVAGFFAFPILLFMFAYAI